MDALDRKIIGELQRDGRISVTELADRLPLSLSATSERLRRLLESDVITGFSATVDPAAQALTAPAGRGTTDLTDRLQQLVAQSGLRDGLANVFVHHTSCSLMVCENADPDVRVDLETVFARLAPDGDPAFRHRDEGPDDMSAHVRSVLTQTAMGLPIRAGRVDLGTWQGLYLWEHRTAPHHRRITVTLVGD